MSVEEMATALRNNGVQIHPSVVQQIAASPKRTQALRTRDFRGEGTAYDHILRVAKAGNLRDGTASGALAADLFQLVGNGRVAASGARCYARTTHTIFSALNPGEFTRLLGKLAVDGAVVLANGETVQWNPQTAPVNGFHADYLWGSLNQLVRFRQLPQGGVLPAVSVQPQNHDLAYGGQMANIYTRLFGKPYVNVGGPQATPHINEITARTGPLLAEFGPHGGSVLTINPQGEAYGIEAGGTEPQHWRCPHGCNHPMGYVVMPTDEVKKYNFQALQYPQSDQSYAVR
jgi:hypothetical protein